MERVRKRTERGPCEEKKRNVATGSARDICVRTIGREKKAKTKQANKTLLLLDLYAALRQIHTPTLRMVQASSTAIFAFL